MSWNFGLLAQAFLAAKNTLTGVLGNNLFAQEIRPETFFAGAFSTPTVMRTWADQSYLITGPGSGSVYGGWSQGANTQAVPTHTGFFINLALTNANVLLNTYNQVTMIWWGIADFSQVTASNNSTATIPSAAQAYQAPVLDGIQVRDSSGNFQGVIGLPYQRVLANTTFRVLPDGLQHQPVPVLLRGPGVRPGQRRDVHGGNQHRDGDPRPARRSVRQAPGTTPRRSESVRAQPSHRPPRSVCSWGSK